MPAPQPPQLAACGATLEAPQTAPGERAPQAAPGERAPAVAVLETHFRDGRFEERAAVLADEVPIAFQYNGVSHAVMLATPADLEDFAIGFAVTEGIAADREDIYGIDLEAAPEGITVAVELSAGAFARLKDRRRTLAGRTGCGICGAENLSQVLRPVPDRHGRGPRLKPAALSQALAGLTREQRLQQATGAVHAAAWCDAAGAVRLVREDVGRHNALDKVIGAVLRAQAGSEPGFVVVTSRASVEMVQKAAFIASTLAAVSAPTRLAARIAGDSGLTLVGFARGREFSVYSHRWRIDSAAD